MVLRNLRNKLLGRSFLLRMATIDRRELIYETRKGN